MTTDTDYIVLGPGEILSMPRNIKVVDLRFLADNDPSEVTVKEAKEALIELSNAGLMEFLPRVAVWLSMTKYPGMDGSVKIAAEEPKKEPKVQKTKTGKGHSKGFTDEEIREIRKSSLPANTLADKFHCSTATIYSIKSRKTHSNVED